MGIEALLSRDDGTKLATPVSPRRVAAVGQRRPHPQLDAERPAPRLAAPVRQKPRVSPRPKKWTATSRTWTSWRFFSSAVMRSSPACSSCSRERSEVMPIAQDYQDIRRLDKAEATFAAMQQGVPILYQAVLWDAQNLTYGAPDFLIRSDVLHDLFPVSVSAQDGAAIRTRSRERGLALPCGGHQVYDRASRRQRSAGQHRQCAGRTRPSYTCTIGCWAACRGSSRPSRICWGAAGSSGKTEEPTHWNG